MVDVNTQNKTISVNVSSSGVTSSVNASGDTSHYYSEKAREWAISNRIVDGVDYSSKYYANKSNQSALNAQSFAQSALETLNNVDSKVQEATNNIEIQKQDTITEIQDIATTQKEEIENLSEQEQSKIIDLGIDTRANVDLSNLSEQGQAKFDEKANVADVLSYSDKPEISGWSMPSNKYIDLTLGASGSSYPAQANGWFYLNKVTAYAGEYINMNNSAGYGVNIQGFANDSSPKIYLPVKKGDVVTVAYNATGSTTRFRFYYAQGEVG